MRSDPGDRLRLRQDMMHRDVRIEFLGVFDTVASLGVPLWGWWFRVFPIWRNIPFATDPAAACRFVYHALAMDERRSQFRSEERSVGKECVRTGRSRWSPYH